MRIDKNRIRRYTKDRKRALLADGYAPKIAAKRVAAYFVRVGRLLLFVNLKKQTYDADYNHTKSEQVAVCNHKHRPLSGAKT